MEYARVLSLEYHLRNMIGSDDDLHAIVQLHSGTERTILASHFPSATPRTTPRDDVSNHDSN
jgi:hypothetical protein